MAEDCFKRACPGGCGEEFLYTDNRFNPPAIPWHIILSLGPGWFDEDRAVVFCPRCDEPLPTDWLPIEEVRKLLPYFEKHPAVLIGGER